MHIYVPVAFALRMGGIINKSMKEKRIQEEKKEGDLIA